MASAASPTEAGSDPLVGRRLGEFVLRERIGQGGFGAVYRAEQALLSREAVVKVLHERRRAVPAAISRFLREAKLASRLDHPYAAHIYSFGAEPDGLVWLAMELVRGTTLDELLQRQGPLSLDRFVPLLDKICEVLHSAHEQGIVHRDIKPANIMVVSRAGRLLPKLLDFGIAKAAGELGDAAPAEATARELSRGELSDEAVTAGGALTGEGAVLGSPAYMAPEQWVNSPAIGPHTDIYALGALSFEALSGRPAFSGNTMMALAKAHATAKLPSLGEGFPARLNEVLHRALAKTPKERYGNALELAADFHAAAGISLDPLALPQLDTVLQEAFILDGPQPIAEAIAQLKLARNLHEAYDALWQTLEVTARYVGLLAVAARARAGPGPSAGDSTAVEALLRTVRQRALSDREWIELAGALVRPFSALRDLHPLPELVGALLERDGPEPLLLLREEAQHEARGTDADAVKAFARAVTALAAFLGRFSFLCNYPLAVARSLGAERWTGLRPPRRAITPMIAADEPNGTVLLLGRDGQRVIPLSPLLQVAAPSPGAAEELFLFEGAGRHGARLVALPTGLTRSDDGIWDWLRGRIFNLGDGAARERGDQRSPYLGLAAFSREDAGEFLGREREIEAAVNRLRLHPLLVVLGPSGAGKSSLVHAGIVPSLPEGWRSLALRPGPAPLSALAVALASAGAPGIDPRLLHDDPAAAAAALRALAGTQPLVVIVDQLEELFTQCGDPRERQAFCAALILALDESDRLRLVATLRDDFLVRAEREPTLRGRLSPALQLVTTPARDQLERILVEPARRRGYRFEDPALPGEMVGAVADQPGALALLAFTAARLWELRDRDFHHLPRKAYDLMGGVGGALGGHAEETFAGMPAMEQALVRDMFRHLVTAAGTRATLSRVELLSAVGTSAGASAEGALEKLIESRLLQVSTGEVESIEIVHETLLTAWPRLDAWQREDAEGARLRDQLRAAARQWEERGRPAGLLWRGGALAELQVWRGRHEHAGLTIVDRAFADASVADARRGARWRRALLGLGFAATTLVALTMTGLRHQAKRAAEEARARLAESHSERARLNWLDGNAQLALLFLSEARRAGRWDSADAFVAARVQTALAMQTVALLGHQGPVLAALRGVDGSPISAGEDGTVRVWDASSGQERVRLVGRHGLVGAVALSSDGGRLAAGYGDGSARLWDLRTGQLLVELEQSGTPIFGIWLSADGRRVVTGSSAGVAVYELPSGRLLRRLEPDGAPLGQVALASPDGARAFIASSDGAVAVRDVETGRTLARLPHPRVVRLFAVSADSRSLATATDDGGIRVWALEARRSVVELAPGPRAVTRLVFSPDASRLAIASEDGLVQIIDIAGRRPPIHLVGHGAAVRSAMFAADGASLATGSDDGSARVWDLGSARAVATLIGHRGPVGIGAFDATGLLTRGEDGTVRIWDPGRGPLRQTIGEAADVRALAFTADGAQLVSSHTDGSVQRWDRRSGRLLAHFSPGLPQPSYAFLSDDGAMIAAFHDPAPEITLFAPPRSTPLAQLIGHRRELQSVCWSPDRSRVAASAVSDDSLWVWRSEDGAPALTLRDGDQQFTGCAFSPDGRTLAAGGRAGTISLWETSAASSARALHGHAGTINGVAFSKDGRRLVSTSDDRSAIVWDLGQGQAVATLAGHRAAVFQASFSPDGRLVLTASLDGTARIWDARLGRLLQVLEGVGVPVLAAAFSPDGAAIATAPLDREIHVWDNADRAISAEELEGLRRCRLDVDLVDGRVVSIGPDRTGCPP